MINWIKRLIAGEGCVTMLSSDYCEGKSNQQLLDALETNSLSMSSGNMIVLELFKRLFHEMDKL